MAVHTSIPLFIKDVPSIPPPFSTLLASYSNIPPSSQSSHITHIRDSAYAHHSYPCLGRWRFLDLDLSTHPLYRQILQILRPEHQATFLDLGCCLGQDLRKLIYDLSTTSEINVSRLYGADLRPDFIDIGYDLFLDQSKLARSQFIAPTDVFDTSPSPPLATLDGKVNVLNCTAVFHLFALDQQHLVADRCLRLLDRSGIKGEEGKKALILGSQTANIHAGEYARGEGAGGLRWRHNGESWRGMWGEVVSKEEWKDAVKGVDVGSVLTERSVQSKERDGLGKEGKGDEDEQYKKRRETVLEAGFRWMAWWVWVDFA